MLQQKSDEDMFLCDIPFFCQRKNTFFLIVQLLLEVFFQTISFINCSE